MAPRDDVLMKSLAGVVREYVSKEMERVTAKMDATVGEFREVIADIQTRIESVRIDPVKGDKGDPGEDGKSITLDDVMPYVEKRIDQFLSSIPLPQDGESVTVEDVTPVLEAQYAKWALEFERRASDLLNSVIRDMPVPRDGEDGRDGVDGKDADEDAIVSRVLESIPKPRDGIDGKDADEPAIVEKVLSQIPVPKDGKDAEPVTDDQIKNAVIDYMKDNPPPSGKDGESVTMDQVADWLEGHVAKWELSFERRAQDFLQKQADKMPVPKDGKDGVSFDDVRIEYDGERTLSFVFLVQGVEKRLDFEMPIPLDVGVWKEDGEYRRGHMATYGGSLWIAQKDAPKGKPGQYNKDWRLAVKKGRDGRSES